MKSIEVPGAEIEVVDRGRGAPVLLVHGFPLDHAMWDAQVEALPARGRVLAPDLRGFGRSGPARETTTMGQFAADLAALLDGLRIARPVVLCGLSMGGYVALEFWRLYPARVRALVLCDTRAAADTPEAAEARRQTAQRALQEGTGFLAETMLPRLLAPATLQSRPEIVAHVRRMILAADRRGVAAAQRGMAERPDATPLLSQIACPTLVVVGEDDVISPPDEMESLARQVPGSRFVTISAAGHLAPLENPAEVNAALHAFLADLVDSR
jgi:pimeloyl-ACP methyl ester carboxylesterase